MKIKRGIPREATPHFIVVMDFLKRYLRHRVANLATLCGKKGVQRDIVYRNRGGGEKWECFEGFENNRMRIKGRRSLYQ